MILFLESIEYVSGWMSQIWKYQKIQTILEDFGQISLMIALDNVTLYCL